MPSDCTGSSLKLTLLALVLEKIFYPIYIIQEILLVIIMRSTWLKSGEKRLFWGKTRGEKPEKRARLTGMRKAEGKGAFS